jgi:6-phosphogluconolactonase
MMSFALLVGGLSPDVQTTTFNFSGGTLTLSSNSSAFGASPSFLALAPSRSVAYVANHGGPALGVTSVALSWTGGALQSATALGHVTVDDPCHIALHPTGRHVFTASYSDGTLTVLPLAADGTAQSPLHTLALGLNAHETVFAGPGGNFVFVPLLGSDAIAQLVFDAGTGSLEVNAAGGAVQLPAGSGPRHLAFHPTLPVAYALCELSSQVAPLLFDAAAGTLAPMAGAAVSSLRGGAPPAEVQAAADVLVSQDGRFLYATNRALPYGAGENSVAVFAIDVTNGALRGPLQWATGDGGASGAVNFPRHAALAPLPGEPFLVVANQLGGSLTVFARDPDTGLLAFVSSTATAPTEKPSFVLPLALL